MSKIELVKSGYWSISTSKHLKIFAQDSIHLDEFDNLNTSGKAGRFLGVIRGSTNIDNVQKMEKMAQSVGIGRRELHTIILPELKSASDGAVEVIKNSAGDIQGIEEYIFSQNTVLEVTGQLFENMNPRDVERITIETMDETKRSPLLETELQQLLNGKGFSEQHIDLSTSLQTSFSLIQKLTSMGKEPIFSNEYVWGKNHHKIAHAFTNLEFDQKQNLREVIDLVQNTQGYPLEKLPSIDASLLLLSKKIGMISPTTISSSRGFQKEFGFSANLLESTPYNDDIMDDVKLLLASIRFGEYYTPYTTIRSPEKFLKYFIGNKIIGPHSANGTDFNLLERRGIVKVIPSPHYNDRYFLELLREDVANEALKVISNPSFNINVEPDNKEINAVLEANEFKSPEECRIKLGKSPEHVTNAMDYLTRVLRDETL